MRRSNHFMSQLGGVFHEASSVIRSMLFGCSLLSHTACGGRSYEQLSEENELCGSAFNADEHNLGHLAGGEPILAMDVFEHAYLPDYGLERGQYIEAFFHNVNWKAVSDHYNKVVAQRGE